VRHFPLLLGLIGGLAAPEPRTRVETGRWHAIVAGITNYRAVARLPHGSADALAFYDYLRAAGVDSSRIYYLPDTLATAEDIDGAMQKVIMEIQKGDSVLFYFAGHGDVENPKLSTHSPAVLLGSTARGNKLGVGFGYQAGGVLKLLDLRGRLGAMEAAGATVIAIVDACRAGGFYDHRLDAAQLVRMALPLATAHMALAADSGELSREGERWGGGHGAFTWYLLQGLREGRTNLFNLMAWVRARVQEDTENRQTPLITGNGKPNLPMLRNQRVTPGGGPDAVPTLLPWLAPALRPAAHPRDTAVDRQVAAFRSALAERRLLEPAAGSAWRILQQLRGMPAARAAVPALAVDLQVALKSRAFEVIANYLEGPARLPAADRFRTAERELQSALELAGPRDLMSPPTRARALFLGAYATIRESNRRLYPRAEAALRQALELVPDASYVINALGVIYLRTDRLPLAEREFSRAIELSPNWVFPRLNLGLALFEQGRHAEAIVKLQEAIAVDSLDADGYSNLGSLYLTLGRYLEAERYLRHATILDPDDSFAYRRLGYLYRLKRQYDRAEAVLDTAVHLAARDPDRYDYSAAVELALLHSASRDGTGGGGDHARARAALQPALEHAPFQPAPLRQLGDLLRYQGKPDSAELMYRRAQALDPTEPWAYQGLGLVHETRQEWDQAERVMRLALDRVYYRPAVWGILADHYERRAAQAEALRAEYEARAEQAWREALAGDSLYRDGYSGLAGLRERRGDYAAAEPWRLRSLALADSSALAPYEVGEFYAAWARQDPSAREARRQQARRFFDRALAIDSTFTSALDARGSLALEQGRFPEAAADFRRAATLGFAANTLTTYSASMVSAATGLFRNGRLAEALAGYQSALALDPANRAAALWLGRVRYLSGDPAAALETADGLLVSAEESLRRELEPLRARALLDLGRPADAEAQIRRFTDPADPAPHWRNYAIHALTRLGQGDEPGALAQLRRAAALTSQLGEERVLAAEFSPQARAVLRQLLARMSPP
jgi:tetratricopeptide (TPR) repeat protein